MGSILGHEARFLRRFRLLEDGPEIMRRAITWRILTALLLASLAASRAGADIVQPVSIQLEEQEPNTFLVQWQVPQTYPARALPEPVLPEDCRAQGERLLQERPGTWLNRQMFRCTDELPGREVGVRYPFVTGGQSAIVRVELLTGERLVHSLEPGENSWTIPEVDAGLVAELWPNLHRAVLDGMRHFLRGWVHLALWLAIALLSGSELALRWVTAFSGGQVVGVVASLLGAIEWPAALAEAAIAIAVVLLVREALTPSDGRRQLLAVCAAAGLMHGLGLVRLLPAPISFSGQEWLYLLLAVLGMDALFLVLVVIAPGFRYLISSRDAGRTLSWISAYGLGAFGVAASLFLVLVNPFAEAATTPKAELPNLPGSDVGSGMPGSRRVAVQGVETPMRSFLSIEPFEVRHQILFRLQDLARELALQPDAVLEIAAQPEVKSRLERLALPLATVVIDSERVEPLVDRVDFLLVDSQGVLPRSEPVPEVVDEAFLGVTLVYPTARTPERVALTWNRFLKSAPQVPATASDPEFAQTAKLTAASPTLAWENHLSVDLIPTVTAVAVEPRKLPLSLAALPFLAAAIFFLVAALRGGGTLSNLAWARMALALGLLIAPWGEVALALPSTFGAVPSAAGAKRILAGVLPNVYRAFEFREESAAYDRLAVSVTGDALSEIYLEHRRALEMEERGGARARVEAVEVKEVREVRPADGGGFEADAVWVVGGTVTHFGHRHFRQNRYDARIELVPFDGSWKIHAIELHDEERIR